MKTSSKQLPKNKPRGHKFVYLYCDPGKVRKFLNSKVGSERSLAFKTNRANLLNYTLKFQKKFLMSKRQFLNFLLALIHTE